jgi:hypothetical protein
MARKPELEPAWLIGLLVAWGRRERGNTGLGYPTICVMLKDGIRGQRRSYEPTGYGTAEVVAVGEAVNALRLMRKLAVMRYVRPWMCLAIDAEMGRTYDTDTWLYHLKGALVELTETMEPKRKRHAESENA